MDNMDKINAALINEIRKFYRRVEVYDMNDGSFIVEVRRSDRLTTFYIENAQIWRMDVFHAGVEAVGEVVKESKLMDMEFPENTLEELRKLIQDDL